MKKPSARLSIPGVLEIKQKDRVRNNIGRYNGKIFSKFMCNIVAVRRVSIVLTVSVNKKKTCGCEHRNIIVTFFWNPVNKRKTQKQSEKKDMCILKVMVTHFLRQI